MDMKPDEIVVRYRQAKHKAEQIKILADLNACGVDDIIQVLTDSGINLRGMNKIRGKLSAIQDEPIPAPVEDTQPTPEEPVEDAEPTSIDDALAVIKNQIDDINAQISVLEQRKQAIISKLKDILPEVVQCENQSR